MYAKDFMTTEITTGNARQTLHEASNLLLKSGNGVLLVKDDDNRLLGTIAESDFIGRELNVPHAMAPIKKIFGQTFREQDVSSLFANAKNKKLESLINNNFGCVSPDTSLNSVIEIMRNRRLDSVVVIENNQPVGVITYKNILKAFDLVTRQ
jgi:predicted transcriptional regulator